MSDRHYVEIDMLATPYARLGTEEGSFGVYSEVRRISVFGPLGYECDRVCEVPRTHRMPIDTARQIAAALDGLLPGDDEVLDAVQTVMRYWIAPSVSAYWLRVTPEVYASFRAALESRCPTAADFVEHGYPAKYLPVSAGG